MPRFYGWLGGWTRSRGHQRGVSRNGDHVEVALCRPDGRGNEDRVEAILYGEETPSIAIHAEPAGGRSHCLYDGPLAELLEAGAKLRLMREGEYVGKETIIDPAITEFVLRGKG